MSTSSSRDPHPARSTADRRELLETFDALGGGESFVLVAVAEARDLLLALQEDRPGLFEWDVLEAGPLHRIEITRRPLARSPSVAELLEHEHARLEGILARTCALVDRERVGEGAQRFAEFRCGLERHMDMEEQVLLEEFGTLAGLDRRAALQVRADHGELRELLKEASASLADGDVLSFREVTGELRALLVDHDAREGGALSILIDAELGSDMAREKLVRRLQRF